MTEAPNAILLFAAGLGTRMAPLTDARPKPLVEVAGKPLLEHALQFCDGLKVVVNVHYLADQIASYLENRDVLISDETGQLLETGGGLKRALPMLRSDPVLTMNTDAVWAGPNPIQTLRKAWSPDAEAHLLLVPRANAVGHSGTGDFDMASDGRLTPGTDFVYTGLQIIRTAGLADISTTAFSMWELWTGMLNRRAMYGQVYTGRWCDVGRPDSIPLAERILQGDDDV